MAQKNLPIIPHIHRLKKNNSMNISVDERDEEKNLQRTSQLLIRCWDALTKVRNYVFPQ